MSSEKNSVTSVTEGRKFSSVNNFQITLCLCVCLMKAVAIGYLGTVGFCISSSVHYLMRENLLLFQAVFILAIKLV